jgi:hypothetical protein
MRKERLDGQVADADEPRRQILRHSDHATGIRQISPIEPLWADAATGGGRNRSKITPGIPRGLPRLLDASTRLHPDLLEEAEILE